MQNLISEIHKTGIIPVIAISDLDKAVPLALALEKGGIPAAEVTLRTPEGIEAIRRISNEMPQVLTGAGTVLSTKQVDAAVDAGAKFIVTPAYNDAVVDYCVQKGIPIIPGCATPSDMGKAVQAGLSMVKFFPAEQMGGLSYLKAVAAPFHMLRFMATGGINAQNIAEYMRYDKMVGCGGSWMVKPSLIEQGDFEEITRLSRQAVESMLEFELAYMGIPAQQEDLSRQALLLLEKLFHFSAEDARVKTISAGGPGAKGRLVVSANRLEPGIAYLERMGFAFASKDPGSGVFLQDEVAGFAIELIEK